MRGGHKTYEVPAMQADAVVSQANPVSGTKYTVLDTTKNVRIIGISAEITWATTQPTPLEVHVTIDGQAYTFTKVDPVSGSIYIAFLKSSLAESAQQMLITSDTYRDVARAFLFEGRSVKVEVEITWATTQPTPLECKVRYAKF